MHTLVALAAFRLATLPSDLASQIGVPLLSEAHLGTVLAQTPHM